MSTTNWVTKQLGSINYFPDERTANEFAAKARTTLLLTMNVELMKEESSGNWIVTQSLKYVTTEGEQSYALPDVPEHE